MIEKVKHTFSPYDIVPVGIFVTDSNYTIVFWNQLMEFWTGVYREEILGKNLRDEFPETNKPIFVESIDRLFEAQLPAIFSTEIHQCYLKCIRYNGVLMRQHTVVSPYYLESEKKDFAIFSIQDVTDQVEKISALIKAQKKAEAASIAKSNFLANMSHEIRTPLNGVIGFTDLLSHSSLNPTQQQYAQNANTSAKSLLNIINGILDFSKIEAGKMELDEISTDIIQLVEEACDVVKYQASKKKLEFLLDIAPNIPNYIKVDSIRLKQILVNLLSNAVKFTEKGQIVFNLGFKPLSGETGEFLFSVKDSGIGLSEEGQKNIFQSFSQADASITRKYGGTGLGLAISTMIVEQMGSKIHLESEIGKGSRFYFSLERFFEKGNSFNVNDIDHIQSILIIDDNKDNQSVLERFFSYFGKNVKLASNALEALTYIESKIFDAIIVDYDMPSVNGIEITEVIVNKLNLPKGALHIILMYGSGDDESLHEECEEVGLTLKLVKPLKMSKLFEALISLKKISKKDEMLEPSVIERLTLDKQNKPLIMIVDDVDMNRLLMEAIFTNYFPYLDTIEAESGEDAIYKVVKHKPALIFLDIQMPDKDGYAVSREIRKLEKELNFQTRIIALTAGVVMGEKDKCLKAGMDDYTPKPATPEALKGMLEKYLKY